MRAAIGTWVATLALCAGGHAAQAQSASRLIPAQVFFRHADIVQAELSPSGRWLAMSTGVGGERIGLVVFDLGPGGKVIQTIRFSDVDVRNFHWVNDERLVLDVIDFASGSGEQPVAPGLFMVRRDGGELLQLVKLQRPFVAGPVIGRQPLEWNHRLLHIPDGDGDEVIVGEYRFDNFGDLQAIIPKRLNVLTRSVEVLAADGPDNARAWWFDARGEPRVAVSRSRGRTALHWREANSRPWRQLREYDALLPPFSARFLDAAGTLYVTAAEGAAATTVLKKYDFA